MLVNNAVFFNKKGVLDMPFDEWHRQIAVILGGAFLFTKHAAQSMIERSVGGSVINIVSTAGHQGEPSNIAYSTAKCGMLNFTRSAAMELVGHGIRVNSLTPTATDPSRILRTRRPLGPHGQKPDSDRSAVMKPFRERHSDAEAAAAPATMAAPRCSSPRDDAAMITGTDLRVDAGAIARYWAWDPRWG